MKIKTIELECAALTVDMDIDMPRMYLHVYVDAPIESILSATKQGHFVVPFYSRSVEDVPDFSGVEDMRVHKPYYVGHLDDPNGEIRKISKAIASSLCGPPLIVNWPEVDA